MDLKLRKMIMQKPCLGIHRSALPSVEEGYIFAETSDHSVAQHEDLELALLVLYLISSHE